MLQNINTFFSQVGNPQSQDIGAFSLEKSWYKPKEKHVWSGMPQEPCTADRSDSCWLLSLPLSNQQRGKKLNGFCPCFPFIILWTETHQLRKLLNSHLFTQMFLKPSNLLVDQLISQSLGSQQNMQTRLNTGQGIQSMHVVDRNHRVDKNHRWC